MFVHLLRNKIFQAPANPLKSWIKRSKYIFSWTFWCVVKRVNTLKCVSAKHPIQWINRSRHIIYVDLLESKCVDGLNAVHVKSIHFHLNRLSEMPIYNAHTMN